MINVILYTRVSTDEQATHGYSIQNQEISGINYCNSKGYNLLNIYREDYSAKTFDRPEWKKLMAFIKSNRGRVNKIVFLKWDRFSRNVYESIKELNELKRLEVSVECIESPVDLNNEESILLQYLYLALPEVENTKISNRTKQGMRQASLNGCWVGKVPLGYERHWHNLEPVRKNATLKKNAEAEIIEDIFTLFTSENLSAEAIRKEIKIRYGKKLSKQGVLDILKNYAYVGKVFVKSHNGEPEQLVKGYHEAIISDDVFQCAQDTLKGKKRKHQRKDNNEEFPLKEIIKCSACDCSFTASVTTKKGGLIKYPYYHCSKTKGHDRYPAKLVHEVFEALLQEFKVKDEIRQAYKKVLVDTINKHNKTIYNEKEVIEKQIELVRKRILNTEDKIADDKSSGSALYGMLIRYKKDEDDLIMKHATLKAEATPKNSDVEYLLELFNSFDILYSNSDFKLKKKIVSSIFPKPIYFTKNDFRTKEVSPLLELLILNSSKLQRLKIETSHFKSGSSSSAPPTGLEPVTL